MRVRGKGKRGELLPCGSCDTGGEIFSPQIDTREKPNLVGNED